MPDTNKLLASGFAEVAPGAATGWPYALAVADPDRARRAGIRSTARMRQWHLDLIMLGGLTALAAAALPDLPRRVVYPLALGAWTNANASGVLVVRPELKDRPSYRVGVGASFAVTTWGFVGLAAVAGRRVTRQSAERPAPPARRRGRAASAAAAAPTTRARRAARGARGGGGRGRASRR
jgi:hypothetical protein